jgi:pimeloyl-ACP methyl ester carboxylesterase
MHYQRTPTMMNQLLRLEVLSAQPSKPSAAKEIEHLQGNHHHTPKKPLLFVHGAFAGAWCWQEHFLPYFAEHGYAAYAVSVRGHGASEGRQQIHHARLSDYVQDVASVAASLPEPPVLVGHSLGGLVVQQYCERHPSAAAVLMASCPPTGLMGTGLYWLAQTPVWNLQTLAWMQHSASTITDIRPALAHTWLFSPTMERAKVEYYAKKIGQESMQAFIDAMFFLPNPRKIHTPMLVLGAEQDAIFPWYEVERTARAYNAPCKIFPNMAHAMMLERDWKHVAHTMLEWLHERGL